MGVEDDVDVVFAFEVGCSTWSPDAPNRAPMFVQYT